MSVVHDIYWYWGEIMVLLANHRGQSKTGQMFVLFECNKMRSWIQWTQRNVCVCVQSILSTKEEKLSLKLALPDFGSHSGWGYPG